MLGLNPDELMLSPTLSNNTPDNVRKRIKQLNAATKLSVCMMAWNNQDEFEPDETALWLDKNVGYAPIFYLEKGKLLSSSSAANGSHAGLVTASVNITATSTHARLGLRICLKTKKRAVEFGEVFIETFNELI